LAEANFEEAAGVWLQRDQVVEPGRSEPGVAANAPFFCHRSSLGHPTRNRGGRFHGRRVDAVLGQELADFRPGYHDSKVEAIEQRSRNARRIAVPHRVPTAT
jgi:hypothetical protein